MIVQIKFLEGAVVLHDLIFESVPESAKAPVSRWKLCAVDSMNSIKAMFKWWMSLFSFFESF